MAEWLFIIFSALNSNRIIFRRKLSSQRHRSGQAQKYRVNAFSAHATASITVKLMQIGSRFHSNSTYISFIHFRGGLFVHFADIISCHYTARWHSVFVSKSTPSVQPQCMRISVDMEYKCCVDTLSNRAWYVLTNSGFVWPLQHYFRKKYPRKCSFVSCSKRWHYKRHTDTTHSDS